MRSLSIKTVWRSLAIASATPLLATAAWAQPSVSVTVAPVHSWVSMVAGDVFEPELLLPTNTDPHNASLRPSQLRNIRQADWVIWIGPQLETGLADLIDELPSNRVWQLTGESESLIHHEYRDAGVIYSQFNGSAEDHGHDHGHGAEEHDHSHTDEHSDHGHGHDHGAESGESTGEDHGHSEDGHGHRPAAAGRSTHAGHDHSAHALDPHLWLDPENARRAVQVIEQKLSELDPENAATYHANADAALARLDDAQAEWRRELSERSAPYAVFHDGYQYFDQAFGIPFAGSVTLDPEQLPGLQTIARLRDGLADANVGCLFAEAQYSDLLIEAVNERLNLPIRRLDAIGLDISTGPDHYFTLMDRLVSGFASCQADQTG